MGRSRDARVVRSSYLFLGVNNATELEWHGQTSSGIPVRPRRPGTRRRFLRPTGRRARVLRTPGREPAASAEDPGVPLPAEAHRTRAGRTLVGRPGHRHRRGSTPPPPVRA